MRETISERGVLLIFLVTLTLVFCTSAFLSMPGDARAAIQLVGTTTGTGTSAAYSMSLTALRGGLASSSSQYDIVIVVNTFSGTANGNPGVGTAGYTEMVDFFSNSTNDTNFSVNYKIMGLVPDNTVSCNGSGSGTVGSVCYALVFRGVDTIIPMDVASTTASATSNEDINCPSITPVTAGALVVCTGGAGGSNLDSFTSWPANHTQAASTTRDAGTLAGSFGTYRFWSGSGAEDPGAFVIDFGTASQNSWAALTMALRPTQPVRKIRLFQGYKIKLIGNKIKVLQQ